ncbi:MAG: cobalamin B12-binding domain-containing protein [Myxococcaceae bacterium]
MCQAHLRAAWGELLVRSRRSTRSSGSWETLVRELITVADEHLATATAQSAVAALYPRFPWPPRGPRALVGCVQGERHEFGARMVADLLALDGWDERFLGADVPIEDLARMVRDVEPRVVGISVTIPVDVAVVRAAIDAVRRSLPSVKVLVGGLATSALRDAPGSLGADAMAQSGPEAVEVARGWK